MNLKFRQPNRCQNGHFIWLYLDILPSGDLVKCYGPWPPDCKCPTHEFGEGFAPIGPYQQFTGLKDRNRKEIFFGDILGTSNDDDSDGYDLWTVEQTGYTVILEPTTPRLGIHSSHWFPDCPEFGDDEESMYEMKFCFVAGNVYENPEIDPTSEENKATAENFAIEADMQVQTDKWKRTI